MSKLSTTPFSILDLAPLRDDDSGPGPALRRSLALAQHAERLGFSRFWVAEHHNMEGIASSAPRVPIFRGQGSVSYRPKLLLSVKTA